MKLCVKCNTPKSPENFYFHRSGKDGDHLSAQCRQCHRKYKKEHKRKLRTGKALTDSK